MGIKGGDEDSSKQSNGHENPETKKFKSCKGTLYYSSSLKSNGNNPFCAGFSRSLPRAPDFLENESEEEEGRSLKDFKYACVGYSVYLDNKVSRPTSDQKSQETELPLCVGLKVLSAHLVVHQAHAHARRDDGMISQTRPTKTAPPVKEDFLTRFGRSAGLVASGVIKNINRVGNYIKETVDDALYKRPK